jgi:hypothetical protein
MDANIYKILTELSEVPVGTKKNISKTMTELFPAYKGSLDGDMLYFLECLKEYTNYDHHMLSYLEGHGIVGLELRMTNDGLVSLKAENDRRLQARVHNSSIELSQSIMATNNAIQQTNTLMLGHAERQEAIMLTQSEFSRQQVAFTEQQVQLTDRQVRLVDTQNNLYRITLLVTGINVIIGLIILIITIQSDSDKKLISALQIQLANQQKEIKRLQLLKSDTVHYVLHYPQSKSKPK